MRFTNAKDMGDFAAKRGGEIEGRLSHRSPAGTFRETGFRERYFKLVNNLLFYYRINEIGQIDMKEPAGLLVLENYSVRIEMESEFPFAFGLLFLDEPDKLHVFTARSEYDVNQWVNTLRRSSYQYWKDRLTAMKSNIAALKDAKEAIKADTSNPKSLSGSLNSLVLTQSPSPSPQRQRRNPFLPPPVPPRPTFVDSSSLAPPPVPERPKAPARTNSPKMRRAKANNNNTGEDLINL